MENPVQIKENPDIVILVNGPGELSSYVKPAVRALHEMSPQLRITLVFTPCPYSTGKETAIASAIPGVSRVISDKEFFRWMIMRKPPENMEFNRSGVVAFMGGDVLYGKMVAKRLKYPAVAYSESYAKWPDIYRKYLVPDQMIYEKFRKQGYPENQIEIVGNLMVDSIKINRTKKEFFGLNGMDPGKKLVSFLPGSREFQIKFTLSFYPDVIKKLSAMRKDLQFAYIISPYLPNNKFIGQLKKLGFTIINDHISVNGIPVRIILNEQIDAMAASDMIVTVPGTNTAEVAIIGTPMVSIFPLDSSNMIPLEGTWDILGRIPLLGFLLKRSYVKIMQKRTRFFAIPNIKTGKAVVPELLGKIQAADVADKVDSLLNNPDALKEMSDQLKAALGKPGAARRIAEEILNEALRKAT